MKVNRKFLRSAERLSLSAIAKDSAAQKIVSAVTAIGFVMQPVAALASTITRADKPDVNLATSPVTKIFAENVFGNVAINKFDKFQLDANHIANMYFGMSETSNSAANLVNFVDSRIDINGTVNAIQNKKIDGNLFFFSSDGMAVGKTGVINAGALYVATPTSTKFDEYKKLDNEDKFNTIIKDEGFAQIPINASGTISVLGKVNAVNAVNLRAAKIGVGKNVSGEAFDGVAADATVTEPGASIRTGVVDFKDIVNVGNANSGLTDDALIAEQTGSGDIVLAAYNNYNDNYSVTDDFSKIAGESVNAELTVAKDAVVKAAGNAKLSAQALNNVLKENYTPSTATNSHLYGQIVTTNATVNVDGTVEAKQVDITADAKNRYISAESSVLNASNATSNIVGALTANLDASYAVLNSKAEVNVGKDAVINATDSDTVGSDGKVVKPALNIKANSSVEAGAGASTALLKVMNVAGTNIIPAAAVTYSKTNNEAAVNIDGTLKSKGGASVTALADSKVNSEAKATTMDVSENPNLGDVALNITTGDNKSSVTIGKTAQMTELQKDVNIEAKSVNSVITKAEVSTGEKAVVATAINVTDYDSKANVNINGNVRSVDGSLSVNAENVLTDNTVIANNAMGSSSFMKNLVTNIKGSQTVESLIGQGGAKDKALDGIKNWLANAKYTPQKLKDKLNAPSTPSTPTQPKPWDKLANLMSTGVSVGVAVESNTADVKIGQGVALAAKNDLNITAKSVIEDIQMQITGKSNNYDKDVDNKALVNASVLYSKLDNTATVTVAGGEEAQNPDNATNVTLTGGKVNIAANSSFEYNRINRMVQEVKDACAKVKAAYKGANNKDISDKAQALSDAADAFFNYAKNNCFSATGEQQVDFMDLFGGQTFGDFTKACNDLTSTLGDKATDIAVGPLNVVSAAAAFANPNSYLNFSAGSANGGKSGPGQGEKPAKIALAGSAVATDLGNNARVLIGKNAKITAKDELAMQAASKQFDVSLAGKLGLNGGGENAAGGTFAVGLADANSLVAVAQGAKLTAGSIDIGTENKIDHIQLSLGAGKGATSGVSGMVGYLEGASNSLVSVDDEAVINAGTGAVNLNAKNDTNVYSAAGAVAMGETAGIGVAATITNFDRYTYAAIGDNGYTAPPQATTEQGESGSDNINNAAPLGEDANADRSKEAEKLANTAAEKRATLQQLVQNASGLRQGTDDGKTYEQADFFGSKTAADTKGSINAGSFKVNAETGGKIINVAVAGGVSTADDSSEAGIFDKLGNFVSNKTNALTNKLHALDHKVAGKINGLMDRQTEAQKVLPTDQTPKATPSGQQSSVTIAGAGSAAINLLDGDTGALVDNVKINIAKDTTNGKTITVTAKDTAMMVAAGGAAGISWKKLTKDNNANSHNAAFGGTVAVNDIDSQTLAVISNSEIENAAAIINNAQKSGSLAAAGLGLALAKNSGGNGGTNIAATVNASVNIADNTAYALLQNNKVNTENTNGEDKTSITNTAFDNDIQITGGVNTSISVGGNNAFVGGATVAYGSLKNDVQSAILGGTYNKISTADIRATTNMTQVGVAANVSVAAGADTSYAFSGNSAYNKLDNYANATVEGVTLTGESLNVAAYDTAESANTQAEYLKKRGLDADGSAYLAQVKEAADESGDSDKPTNVDITRGGNVIVTGAVSVGVTTGNDGGSAAASVTVSDIDNDYNAKIKDSNITTTGKGSGDDLVGTNVNAASHTVLAGFAAGVAGTAGSFGVGGSANWQSLNNDITAAVENSTLVTPKTDVKAESGALAVNVAGQIGVTAGEKSKLGAGLAVAYNSLNNTTGAYVKGSEISGANDDASSILNVDAANKGNVYSVGAAVTAGTAEAALNGVVVVNKGKNDVEAVIDKYDDGRTKLNNMSKVAVKSSDDSNQLAVIGNVSVAAGKSAKAAIGGSVAINDIGALAGGKQSNRAAINNADITTAKDGKISVNAVDESTLTTISAGVAITSGNFAFSGGGSAALIEKETKTELKNTNVNADDAAQGDVEASAKGTAKITTVGVMGAVAKNAAAGFGIAVNKIDADTKTEIEGGTYKTDNLIAKSDSVAELTSIGISAAAAKNAGVGGNVTVNLIGNDTATKINHATIIANNNIAALATSSETLHNYAGAMGAALGGQVGIGMSVAYNEITGNTESVVDNSTLQASGKAALGEDVSQKHKDSKGIVVAADAEHALNNVIVTAGLAASSDAAVAVSGTVAVNHLDGETNAKINNTEANTSGTAGDVSVLAKDKTNVISAVGAASVAMGADAGVGFGAASDTNLLSRNVTAEIDGGDAKKAFNADKLTVDAQSENETSTTAVGAAVAAAAYGAAGVAGTVSVTKTDAVTLAKVNNITGYNKGTTINAHRSNDITLVGSSLAVAGGMGAGAGGISVGVLSDDSRTEAQLTNAHIKHYANDKAQDIIHADNSTNVTTGIAAASAAIAIGGAAAGSVGVNNFNNTVKTSVANSSIENADTITADADNHLTTNFVTVSAAGGLVGGSLGVGVNTIDTSVVTELNNSELDANNVTVAADETRDIKQTAANAAVGGVALGANVLVTNIGSAVQGTYTTSNNDSIDVDGTNGNNKHYAMADADEGIGEQNSINSGAYNQFVHKYQSEDSSAVKGLEAAGRGGNTEAKGVQVIVDNGSIVNASNKADIKANTTTNTNIAAGGATVGAVSATGTFSILDVKRNSGVAVKNSSISAKEIAIASKQAGTADMNIYQGTGGMVGLNVAVGIAKLKGANKVELDGATLKNADKIEVKAEDESKVNANALGVAVGAVTLGSITAIAENESTNDIVVEKSKVTTVEEYNDKAATIDITADKRNTVTAHAMGGSAGMANGSAIVANATDNGTSNITLGKANDTAKKNTFSANTLNVNAKASPAVKAVADSVAVALTYGASAAVATATANGGANVTVNNGEELLVDKANLQADIYAQDGMKNAEAKAEGNSGSGLINVGANVATAKSNASANVNVGAIKGKIREVVTGKKTVYSNNGTPTVTETKKTVGATALNISSNNSTIAFADARGVNIGGVFSSGNNVAKTNNTSATNAVLSAGNDELLLGSLNVTASGAGDNLTTADGSGGGLVSADLAAYAENRMNANTTTTVKGKLNVNGEVKINALQNDRANLLADALKATVIGASATEASNEIKGETKVDTDGLTLTGANNLTINANNTVTVGDSEKYAVKGSGYGGVNVQGAVLDNKIDKKAAINLGSAKITTAGAQDYEAETDADVNVGGYIKAAGAGAFTWVDVDNEVKAEDSITVGSDAKLKTTKADKDITLAAVDNMTINVIGVADTQGAAIGGASSDVTNKTTRNNSITVAGNAALYSMNDVNLYAGSDINGAAGKLKLNVDSEAYNKTALGLGKPKLKDDILQNNNVTLNKGSNISSVRNINLYADAGTETIRDTSVMYNWYYSDKDENYTSSTIGDNEPQNKHSNNYIQADGTLTAGVQNKQFITIGKDGSLVFLDSAVRDGVNNVSGNNAIGESELRNQITASDGINKDDIVIGTMDYGTTLFERYEQVRKLMNEYSEDTTSTAYLGYKAELQRITGELQTMGLIEEIKGSDGKVYFAPIKGATIDYISLPDIVASGGNINITTDTLAGSGTMEAKGAPEVTVTNNTNLYMKINNITVGDAGGEINYNGVGLKSSDYNKTINELNIDKVKNAQFSKVMPTAEAGTGGTITVNGNYGGSHVQAKVTVDGKEQTIETKPKADIEINGYVNAKKGIVNITSKANNIIIQGASANSSAGVSGKEVHLTAASGSVSQGYTDGITNIGGSVQTQYNDKYNALKKYFDDKYGYEKTENISGEVTTSTKAKDLTGNMIVGENIYIIASDININGYMQSGYADYYVTVDDGIAATINSIKNSYKGGSLSDAVVTTGTKYRVVKGENVWDEATKSYKRQLDVYYNPATGKLVVPDVDVNGGKIYLTGRISSTGGGTIKALDGAYNVAVTNNTANTLQLGRLVSNKSDGLISITDTGRGKLTEITRSGAKEYAISDINKLHGTNVSTSEYNPQTGLRYNWTTGQTVSTSKTYQNTVKAGLWGLVETMDDTKLTEFEQHNKPIKESDSTKNPKPNGEYIGTINNSTVNSSDFSVIYDNKVLNNTKTGPGEPERWSSGFLGWFKWERYTWTRHTGTSQQYVASVKADNPINIGFIGHDNGNINVNSNGSVDIKGKLASTVGGSISLTSNNGSITQNGVNMVSDNVNLRAQTGINNIGITSIGDTVNLSAANNKSGDIDITVAGAYGKAGNVLVGSIVNSGNDEVHLTADGNINQSGNAASIIGKRIDLSSISGAIGLQIKASTEVVDATDSLSASINANAKGNINLTQTEGDMRVGQIKSEQGDVTINVTEGNVVDALPDGEIIDRGDTDALIQKWKDLGLISGEGSYTAKQKQDVDEYKQQVTDEFKQYKDLNDYYQKNKLTDAEKAAYESYKNAKDSYDALTKEFKDYQNQSIYYTDDKNIPQKAGYKTDADYQKALEAYNTGKTAYAALKDKCEGSANAEVYARSKMSTESWNTYNAPQAGGKDMKATFGSYDSYQDLQARYSGYADADAYLKSDTAQKHISELTDASRSWTENQLLYAIQDSIINPSSDSGDNISKAPNLIGQSITINAAKGSVGLDSDTVTEIELAGISDRVDDLKKLVNASASTVKWDKAAGKATITPKNPLGMQLTSANGKLSVNATENVYITNRKDATDNPLNIDTIKTEGNVRLQSNNGIYNLHNGKGAAISGKDLLLQAGTGGVGKADKLLTINNNGKVTATGTQGVYLEQVGDNALQIVSVAAKGDIVLKAKGDIISADEEDTTAQGYINNESNNGTITFEAGGSAGSAEHKLRIKNADDNHTDKGISVTAGKDVYLQGISTTIAENAEANGTMFINGITAKGIVDVAANGNLNIKGAVNNNASGNVTMTAEKSIAVNAAITNADANIILSARNNVGLDENAVLQAKKVNLVASAVRNLGENAAAGNITQNANSSIIADKVVASALNGIALSSAKNTLKAIDVANMDKGAINLANDGTHDLTVVIAHKNDGDVTVHNYQNGNITSNMKVESQVEAEGAVNYINDAGSITLPDAATFTSEAEEFGNLKTYDNVIDNVKRTTKAKKVVNIQAKNGDVINSGDIDSDEAVVITTETGSGNITNTGNIRGTDVSLITENGNIKSDGTLTSTSGDVTANTGKGNIELNADITSAQDVLLTTGDGSIITRGIINANRHVKANATTGFTSEKSITAANGDVEIITQTGDINTNGDVTANTGNAALNSKGGNVNTGSVTANNDVDIDAAQDITANGNLTSTNANVDLQAGGSITTSGQVKAYDNIIANANGNIATNGDVTAQNGKAVLNSSAGSVTTQNVTADQAVDIDAAYDITADGNLTSNNGDITLDAGGSITTNSTVDANNNVIANANGDINTKGDVTATNGNAVLNSKGGSVTMQNVTANNEVDIDAANNITANGSLTSTNANVDLNAGGSITTNGQVTAQKNVDYNAKGSITTGGIINSTTGNINLQTDAAQGDIIFGGDVTAEHGNINIDVLQNGNVTDDDNKFTALGDKGDINSGNFALQIKGAGDVDLHEIYATNNATINVANGNLTLAKIDGNLVALQLKTEGKQLKVDELIAGAKIIAQGSDIDLNKIQQRLDADGLLTIVPDGAQLNKPIDNLKIGEIITNKGVRFEHLWLNNGSIKVSEGMFHIDKLVVNNVAHFSNKHMKTAVWGAPPQRDGSDSVYWNNIAVNNPADNLTEWQQEGTNPDKWMFLHFTAQPNVQHSNGALLDLRNYDYVYDQRFTAVDHMLQQLNENKAEEYDINHAPDVVQYFRYDLYDLDEDDNKSEPVKITVEA